MSNDSDRVDYRTLLQRANQTLAAMQDRLARAEGALREPIAVVGVGLRFPGGVHNLSTFWSLLHDGVDAVTEIPPDRWNVDEYYDPDPVTLGKTNSRWTAFLDGVDRFDPSFFGISPREAASMDPQHRLLLEVSWEALENAGYAPSALNGSSTGVFIGMVGVDYGVLPRGELKLDAHYGTGVSRSIAAGRISYLLGLHGPSMAIDTACSSSAVATHLACQSLRLGECSAALAGGVNLILAPDGSISASQSRMMSPSGRCRTFDAAADGYVRAEGCAMLLLKRLSDAIADRDNILAVILGSAVNQDGRSNGITAPNGRAQERILRSALSDAGVGPEAVSLIEAHGTGTPLGDPIEMRAIGDVYGAGRAPGEPLMVGSVKTNIGHSEGVAGSAGLIKLILALQHRVVPPNLHLEQPNPFIPWSRLPVTVPTTPTPWHVREGGRRIAAVSSFGFSGTNSHIILAEPPAVPAAPVSVERPYRLVALSAKTPTALVELASNYAEALRASPEPCFGEVAYTANTGRSHFDHRLAVIASSTSECAGKLASVAAGETPEGVRLADSASEPEIAFLFTGQGSQYVGMGRRLFETEPVFRSTMERCDELLRPHLQRPLLSVLYPSPEENSDAEHLINQTAYTQPALFALEYSLAELWRSWGIVPSLVTGHSVGEYVAACVAGVFSLEQGLALIATRARLMQALPAGGAMAALFGSASLIEAAIAPHRELLGIAAFNGPNDLVLAGDATALQSVLASLEKSGVSHRLLKVSHAFHSPLMRPMLEQFAAAAAEVDFHPPKVGLVSNVTGSLAGAEVASSDYWVEHVIAPVRFGRGVETLEREGCSVLLEIGPGPTLLGLSSRSKLPGVVHKLSSLHPGRDDSRQMLEGLATLYVHGAEVDWRGVERDERQRRIPLPTYPFQRQRYWATFPHRSQSGERPWLTPLLQEGIRSPLLAGAAFQSRLGVEAVPFLGDHRIFGAPLMPAAAFVELAIAAARDSFGAHCTLESLQIREPLGLSGTGSTLVQVAISELQAGVADFQIVSLLEEGEEPEWRVHATGQVHTGDESPNAAPPSVNEVRARCTSDMPVDALYDRFAELGVDYAGAFRSLRSVQRRDGEALGWIELRADLGAQADGHNLHPGLLDSCLQLLGPALVGAGDPEETDTIYLPVEIGRYRLYGTGSSPFWCVATIRPPAGDGQLITGDLTLVREDGSLLAEVSGITLKRTDRAVLGKRSTAASRPDTDDWLYSLQWEPAESGPPKGERFSGSYVIVAGEEALAASLAERIVDLGGSCRVLQSEQVASLEPGALRALLETTEAAQDPVLGVIYLTSTCAHEVTTAPELMAGQRATCGDILKIVQSLGDSATPPPRLWLVTRHAQAVHGDSRPVVPAASTVWGLANTISAEHPELRCVCVDLDQIADADLLSAELLTEDGEDRIAWRAGRRHVARLVPRRRSGAVDEGVELHISEPGILENLVLRPAARRAPDAGEVEIEVRASGLNFRDVINALGMYPGNAGPLGSECAGVVTAVGEGVTRFQVGDEVIALAGGTFRSHVVAQVSGVYPKPSWMGFDEAVTLPITFLTAYYGLHDLAGIKPGDKVLVHAAAGGVGLAAVQVAQRAGAIVYGTAGSPEKRAYLESIGVTRVMSSRDLHFAEEILEITGGKGVDIVLNSLNDEFIPRGIAALANGGCFLEIGKRGIWTAEQVSAVNPTLRYFAYDLVEAMRDAPDWMSAALDALMPDFESGALRPLPMHRFALEAAADAFRFMAQAKHTGKIVLVQESRDRNRGVTIRSDRSYLISGGLGGLGLVVARGLVERGARSLVLLGRGSPSAEASQVIGELESIGAAVETVRGDVAEEGDVEHALEVAGRMAPLAGVVHSAGVLDDGLLPQQSWERFETVMRPKILGSWNLHTHTRELPLDFFILFSTGSSILGSAGQANYSSANAFLDGLAHRRRAEGLPATSINWGAWSGVGMAAAMAESTERRWKEHGLTPIDPDNGMRIFARILEEGPTQVAVLPIDWARFQSRAAKGRPRALLAHLPTGVGRKSPAAPAAPGDFLRKIKGIKPALQKDSLRRHVEEKVARVLRLDPSSPPSPHRGLSDLGMDSLMAVELSNHFEVSFDRKFPSTLAFEYPTIEALTDHLMITVLPQRDAGEMESAAQGSRRGADALAPATSVSDMTDAEAAEKLLEELESAGY